MPGKNDPSLPGASYLTDWELYRSGITSDDQTDTDAHVAAVTDVIDLSRNANGLTNQIWIALNRTAGSGQVTLTIFQEVNGTFAAIVGQLQVGTQGSLDNKAIQKFTGLVAAKYRVLITGIGGGGHWNLHAAHS